MIKCFSSTAVIFFIAATFSTNAQTFQRTDTGVKTTASANGIEIRFYSLTIVRVLKSPGSGIVAKESLSVTKTPGKTLFTVKLNGDELSLATAALSVVFNQKTGQFSFKTPEGAVLLKEKESGILNNAKRNKILVKNKHMQASLSLKKTNIF